VTSQCSPCPLAGFKGSTSKGREKVEGKGREVTGREGRGQKGKGGGMRGPQVPGAPHWQKTGLSVA